MKTRVITAIIALAVFVGVLLAPPIVFTIALAAVTVIMLLECYKATGTDTAMKIVGFVSAILMLVSMCLIVDWHAELTFLKFDGGNFIFVYASATVILLLYMILTVVKHGKRDYKDILSSGFLTFYVIVSMWCIWYVKEFFHTQAMLLIFISAWSSDTFAYFSGRFFGKHKLIPHVSPNKTVEGAVGGVVGAMLCCVLYLFILDKLPNGDVSMNFAEIIISGAAVGFIGAIAAQTGDLIASAIKRDTGIKDFGWIFPGHGGFMDRFDSVMFIAPAFLSLIMMCLFVSTIFDVLL